MKKIIVSAVTIVAVAAVVVGATTAFFTDTETSTGNTFTAGAIDLTIDNKSYAIDYTIPGLNNPVGKMVLSEKTSWSLADLTNQLFFNFVDLKPGDVGEDTISIHVNNNDAWVCMATEITGTPENGVTEPEGQVDTTSGSNKGELQDELNFVFWADDGDNVLEQNELNNGVFEGTAEKFMNSSPRTVADSNLNIFTGTPNTPLVGGGTYHIAKAWCFGELGLDSPVATGAGKDPTVATGVTCNGKDVSNVSQTDGVKGSIEFFAVQSRNNSEFTCANDYTPSWNK